MSEPESGTSAGVETGVAYSTSVAKPPDKSGSWTARVTIDSGSSAGKTDSKVRVGSISELLKGA